MPHIGPARGSLSTTAQKAEIIGVSEGQLRAAGVDVATLFGLSPIAYRRVDGVSATHLLVDGVSLPRRLLNQPVVVGQWLRFSARPNGAIELRVDLKATLAGESRLTDLFIALKSR